jgi:ATP-dependent helicase/nuclease subunit A
MGRTGMKTNLISFTPEQESAINHRGSSLLVSAAAGSGKTRVLVERLLSSLEEGSSIDEFLVITYTRAAAFELRERIHESLLTRLSESPGNKRIRRQVMLCKGAQIDTIHGFCTDILRENAHLVGLPADFRVADESESSMIKSEVLDNTLNEAYDNMAEIQGFDTLIETVIEGRDDKKLIEIILDIHGKLQSLPYPARWLKETVEKLQITGIDDISETAYGSYLHNMIAKTVNYYHSEMLYLREEAKLHPDFELRYLESINISIEGIAALEAALKIGWNEAGKRRIVEFPRTKPITGYNELKIIRTRCRDELKKCTEMLASSSEEHIADMGLLTRPHVAVLNLVSEFDEAYSIEKKKRGVVDFSDLEHLTLALLIDNSTGEKTDLAKSLSKRYKEIMVDEYQDVNEIQETIFNAVSQESNNIFMVGDVKQSIYRFRLADPSIFLSKYNSPKSNIIHLSKNFRSQTGILETVNDLFKNIMSVDLGEMEYTDAERLVAGRTEENGKQGKKGIQGIAETPVEIDFLSINKEDLAPDEENPDSTLVEAQHVADKISQLINMSYMIPDGSGDKRPIKYSDIVILSRSLRGTAWKFAAALSERGIPADLSGSDGFFEKIEIMSVLSLLSVIDNPLQDIPLASTLSGPVYKFSSDELAEIRASSSSEYLYESIIQSAEHNNVAEETVCKCKKVLSDLEDYRLKASYLPSDRFIWHVYNQTSLLEIMSAMKGGEKRRRNLLLLVEHAGRCEESGYKGLFGFLSNIRSLQEREADLSDGATVSSKSTDGYNAVRIMSIHKSKGLEFPVVFLVNTSKRFNFTDLYKTLVFHKALGVGSTLIDKKRQIKYSTLPKIAIQSKIKSEMLSEELRVLYVAMTRAREKLVITGVFKDVLSKREGLSHLKPGRVASQVLSSFNSIGEWIMAGTKEMSSNEVAINYITASLQLPQTTITTTTSALESKQEPVIVEKKDLIQKSEPKKHEPVFDFEYPYKMSPNLPSKLTVTGLKKLNDAEAENASWLHSEKATMQKYRHPKFISEKIKKSAAERGVLIHLIMQHADYNRCSCDSDMRKELQRLAIRGIIDADEEAGVDIEKLVKLFNSDIGVRLIHAKVLKREFKFSLLVPAEEFYHGASVDDKILLQGVIDCFFEENGELVIIDFKTDNVTAETIKSRTEQYTPQLQTYAKALERITGKSVKERIIYFFATDTAINV